MKPTENTFSFTAKVWEHEGTGSWHFVSLPEDEADDIEEMFGGNARGFGSLRSDRARGHPVAQVEYSGDGTLMLNAVPWSSVQSDDHPDS